MDLIESILNVLVLAIGLTGGGVVGGGGVVSSLSPFLQAINSVENNKKSVK
jgi:hypothetical protein